MSRKLTEPEIRAAIDHAKRYPVGCGHVFFPDTNTYTPWSAAEYIEMHPLDIRNG